LRRSEPFYPLWLHLSKASRNNTGSNLHMEAGNSYGCLIAVHSDQAGPKGKTMNAYAC